MGDVVESVSINLSSIDAISSALCAKSLPSIGADAMIHLLTDTSIFVPLPNGCLCQMSGVPVVNLRPAAPATDAAKGPVDKRALQAGGPSGRPAKRLKTYDSVGSSRSGQGQKADDGAL